MDWYCAGTHFEPQSGEAPPFDWFKVKCYELIPVHLSLLFNSVGLVLENTSRSTCVQSVSPLAPLSNNISIIIVNEL